MECIDCKEWRRLSLIQGCSLRLVGGSVPHELVSGDQLERKSRSRETALSKADVVILRLLLPHAR